jgi:hypothetical protein
MSAKKPKVLHVVIYQWSGEKKYHADVFTSKVKANRCMDGTQYGVIARRMQLEVPL